MRKIAKLLAIEALSKHLHASQEKYLKEKTIAFKGCHSSHSRTMKKAAMALNNLEMFTTVTYRFDTKKTTEATIRCKNF